MPTATYKIQPVDFDLGLPILLGAGLGLGLAAGVGLINFRREDKEDYSTPHPLPQLELVSPLFEPLKISNPVSTDTPKKWIEPIKESIPSPSANEDEPAKEWEPELDSLVTEPAVLLYGSVGSGKSSKGGYLVTKHLENGHYVEIINPLNKFGQYQPLKVWGAGNDFKDGESGIKQFSREAVKRLQKRSVSNYDPFQDTHWFLLLEEVTNWESKMSQLIMADFLEVCTQYLRQANMSVALVSHGKTLTCIGGKGAGNGKKNTLMGQFLRLNCQAKQDLSVPGGKSCAGWGILEWNVGGDEKTKRVEIPQHWQPPNKEYDYSGLVQFTSPNDTKTGPEDELKKDSEPLPPHMQAILDFCKEYYSKNNQPVKARDVQRSNWVLIKEQNLTPYAIRVAFQLLAEQGYGSVKGEHEYLVFIPSPD